MQKVLDKDNINSYPKNFSSIKPDNTQTSIERTDNIEVQLAQLDLNGQVVNQGAEFIAQAQSSPKNSTSYMPEIDGLRALAILLVLIYHAYPESLPGGYIGVDVFFVISGYLISQIIIKQTHKDKFTYRNFYVRRIKRIIPALLVVLTATLLIVWRYCQLDQTILTLNTLDASLAFGANIQVLLYEKGYFDADMHSNFLLHLWSLGVEEQFYIFWPCILMVVLKKFQNKVLSVLGGYAVSSFLLSIICVYLNQKFAFYFPFCRFWQMAVGGILAYLNFSFKDSRINNALSTVSLVGILFTSFMINQKSLFPGFWALIPTLGAACIIQAKNKAFINKYILSSKPVVFIGKISYSLYLWHWPLLVFSRTFYPSGSDSIFASIPFILLLCVLLSCMTYLIVQRPIRKSKKSKKIVIILVTLMVIIFALSLTRFILIQKENQSMNWSQQDIYFQRVDQQFQPRQDQDYVIRKGKKHPNFSKSQNRQNPTIEKIQASPQDHWLDSSTGRQTFLDRKIDQSSIFYEADQPQMTGYNSLNEGRQNKLLVLGDSHAMRLSYRFQQLHKQSKAKNTEEKFPTVVGMYHSSYGLNNVHADFLDFALRIVEKHKIHRVFMICHWLIYWCDDVHKEGTYCHMDRVKKEIAEMMAYVKKFQQLGAEVTTLSIDLDKYELNPANLVDSSGVISKNLKPFSLTQFRNKFSVIIEPYEKAIRQNNATMVDISQNLCWEDRCYVTSPRGYAPYTDSGHYGKFYARHWLSVLDFLVQF